MEVKRLVSRNFAEINGEKALLQVSFLKNNRRQSFEVEEVEDIDLGKVKEHLQQGESVFITLKRKEKLKPRLKKGEATEEPWYFTHI
jgi:hypothetical protein